jgi:hypothetical protein
VVGSGDFNAAAAITNAGNISDNAIPDDIVDTSTNELVITASLAPMGILTAPESLTVTTEITESGARVMPESMPVSDADASAATARIQVIAMPALNDMDALLSLDATESPGFSIAPDDSTDLMFSAAFSNRDSQAYDAYELRLDYEQQRGFVDAVI